MKWYRKAADQGNANAFQNLGFMYEKGLGVPQDNTEALKWYRKAADQGQPDAQKSFTRLSEVENAVEQQKEADAKHAVEIAPLLARRKDIGETVCDPEGNIYGQVDKVHDDQIKVLENTYRNGGQIEVWMSYNKVIVCQ
jgi:hypothetical protein